MTLGALGLELLRCLGNGWMIGIPIASVTVVALRFLRGAAPRARQILALASFFSVALATLPWTNRSSEVVAQPSTSPTPVAVIELPVTGDSSTTAGLALLWLGIAGVLLVREIGGHVRLRRQRSRWRHVDADLRDALGWPRSIELVTGDGPGPFTVGLLRPTVFIPSWLVSEQPAASVAAIAHHEIDHARWRDPLVTSIMRITRMTLWPILPLLVLERLTGQEMEAAADHAAVTSIGRDQTPLGRRLAYAESLVAVSARLREVPLLAVSLGRGSIEDRVSRILEPSRMSLPKVALALTVVAGGVAILQATPVVIAGRLPREARRASSSASRVESTRAHAGELPSSEIAAAAPARREDADRIAPAIQSGETTPAVRPLALGTRMTDLRSLGGDLGEEPMVSSAPPVIDIPTIERKTIVKSTSIRKVIQRVKRIQRTRGGSTRIVVPIRLGGEGGKRSPSSSGSGPDP